MRTASTRNLIAAALVCALALITATAARSADKPNIVVILADDLGNADLGYRGSKIRTPNIDALAKGGVRLESYYGQQLCTPARAALMTGRYPMRYGLQTAVIFPGHTYGLPTDETTLPQALKAVGYTTAMVGKWHLGHADRKYWPQNRGFDHFYGNLVGEVDYFTKDRGGITDWQRNGNFLKEEGYFTTQIGDEAVKLIENHDTKKPLFLYFASLAPHSPLQAPKADVDAYKSVFENEEKRAYAAMITHLDTQIGRIVAALEKKGMRENTLIFFTTDNGGIRKMKVHAPGGKPAADPPASNGGFRDGKASLYEGGVHVPAMMNWPAGLKPGVVNEPLHHVDLMPTLLAIAGGKGSSDHPFDGKDAMATLAKGKASPHSHQRRDLPWRPAQGQLEASKSGPVAGQDRAVRSVQRSRREDQRRRSIPGGGPGPGSALGGLRQGAEDQRVAQSTAVLHGPAGYDSVRSGVRY
jgi:arylsulfatase A-like enzyme